MIRAFYYIAMLSILYQPHTTAALRRGVFTMATSWLRKPHYDATSPLQSMYNALTAAGHISPANPEGSLHVSNCLEHMSSVSLKDLGLQSYKFNKQMCVTIAANAKFHIAAFLLPKGRSLPIHDHPNMAVFSKLITGELKVRAFTPSDAHSSNQTANKDKDEDKHNKCKGIPATLFHDTVKSTQDDAWVITSKECNYHEFTALSDCVILDVLVPPYEYPARTCTYYNAVELPTDNSATGITGSTDKATSSSNVREVHASQGKQEYMLEIVPEEMVLRKYGLPVSIEYKGYVPARPAQ